MLICGVCKTEFEPTANQKKRLRWASTRPRNGFMCSRECLSQLGVRSRKVEKRLSPRRLAYSRVNNAIETGLMIRPEKCERCSNNPGLDRLGRSRIEGHHPDHSKPLDVIWLCDGCHKAETPRARGERSGCSRLTVAKVRHIRQSIKKRGDMMRLAKKYGVTHKAIADVRDRKTWGHVQ